jgi:UTP-glucose-1-phosphate uridylyltransferase
MIIGIIPACGDAIRMGGVAKFNLKIPKSDNTLISWHIKSQLDYCDKVVVVVKKEYNNLFEMFKNDKRIIILLEKTSSMSETVAKAIEKFDADQYVVGMPDTFVVGDNPYKNIMTTNINSDLNVGGFKIKNSQKGKLGQINIVNNIVVDWIDKSINCDYEYSWGFLRFNKSIVKLIDKKTPHIGYVINSAIKNNSLVTASIIDGEYFDCGTQDEYQEFLKYIDGV